MLRNGEGRPITLRGRKARAIVAYLASHGGDRATRERLIYLLWAERGEAQARGSLRQSLLEIRRAAPDLISSDYDHAWIDCARLQSDDFDRRQADEDLFDDLDGVTPEFDHWLRCERASEAAEEWSDLQRQVEEMLTSGNGSAALRLTDRMQAIDPYNEDWLRFAMKAECQAGHPAAIQTRFSEMERILKRELGVPLSTQTRTQHDDLLAELARPSALPASRQSPEEVAVHGRLLPASGSYFRPWLVAAGVVGLVATLSLSQSAQTAASVPSRIAVLPFRALGGVDSAFAEGIAEEVLSDLSQHRDLQTVGRTSSWMFKDKGEDLRLVGRKLDVRYVGEGSVRRQGSRLRLNIALIDVRDSSTLWSGRFSSSSRDAQRMEDAAANAIFERLGIAKMAGDRYADPRAYALYLRAKAAIRDRNWPRMDEARDLLQRAVKIDPNFAPAWAQLGGALTFIGDRDPASGGDLRKANARALAAARQAVSLDPNLAEGHQMLGFVVGYDTADGRAHLRRALQLDPRNPQTIYWWGNAAGAAGDYALQERAARRALMLDPLWRRPAESVAGYALIDGRRSEAYSYVERLRDSDPHAALEVEMSLLHSEGDLSRVVQLGRAEGNITAVQGSAAKMSLAWSLLELGYVREALLIGGVSPFERLIYLRALPERAAILVETSESVGASEEPWLLMPLLLELARTGRHADIAALFDRPRSAINRLRRIEEGNRQHRAQMSAIIGYALSRVGRHREAAQLFRAADEANRVLLANRKMSPVALAEIAVSESNLGRGDSAIVLLQRAVARGWFAFEGSNYRLDEMPGLMRLRGDPRFERLVRITNARRDRERRETEALRLI